MGQLQKMQLVNNFNSQKQQQILSRYLLVIIENQRLHNKLHQISLHNPKQDESYIIQRINSIETSMGTQLKQKQLQVSQLHSTIQQLRKQNKQLKFILQQFESKCQRIEKQYKQQISNFDKQPKYKSNNRYINEQPDKQHYLIQVLERQKQQLDQQVNRLKNVTIKQLQADIEVLKKQNATYANSINTCIQQDKKINIQKNKLQQQLQKCMQSLNKEKKEKLQAQNDIKVKMEQFNRKIKDQQKQYKLQACQQQQQANILQKKSEQHEQEISKLKQNIAIALSDVGKKSKKLKQYDDNYRLYLNKMTNLSNQNELLKNQLKKQKQKYDKCKYQSQQKVKQLQHQIKQRMYKLQYNHKQETSKRTQQFESKLSQLNQQTKQKVAEQNKKLQLQIEHLKLNLLNRQKHHVQVFNKQEQQKNEAIRQWNQILAEMGTQKQIINSLQQQIDFYRKSIRPAQNIQKISNQIIQKQNYDQKQKQKWSEKSMQVKFRQSSSSLPDKNIHTINNSPINQIMQKTNQSLINKKHLKTQQNKKMNFNKKSHQFSSQILCCQQCRNNSDKSTKSKDLFSRNIAIGQNQLKNRQSLNRNQRLSLMNKIQNEQKSEDNLNQKLKMYESCQLTRPQSNGRIEQNSMNYKYSHTTNHNSAINFINRQNKQNLFGILGKESIGIKNQQLNKVVRSVKKQFSLQKNRNSQCKQNYSLKRSSSLKTAHSQDTHIQQIRKYLSFDITGLRNQNLGKQVQGKHKQFNRVYSQQNQIAKLSAISIDQKYFLLDKVNKLNSWKEHKGLNKQLKSYNLQRRSFGLLENRSARLPNKTIQKQNIDQIINRKCNYVTER